LINEFDFRRISLLLTLSTSLPIYQLKQQPILKKLPVSKNKNNFMRVIPDVI